ncbi:hypothetical protein LPJ55_002025 [Coemansia sp. RSA 990]|nr:hypothetical protein LPJ55_002025 [Coemansia sp. RSA 990]
MGTDVAETLNNGAPIATVGSCPDYTITVTNQVFATLTTTITPSWLAIPDQQYVPNAGFAQPTEAVANGYGNAAAYGGAYDNAGDYANAYDGGNDYANAYDDGNDYANAYDDGNDYGAGYY